MQLDFLDRVWGTATGYVQFQQKRKDADEKRTGAPTDTKEFLWPDERDRIGRYLSLREEEDLYFAVPLYNKAGRRQSEVKLLNAVYVDDDGVESVANYKLMPSVSVESSPGHFHHYWVLDQPANPEDVARVGFEISKAHRHDSAIHDDLVANDSDRMQWDKDWREHKHCGTDPGGWDLTQILRVPGTLNTKKEYGNEPWRIPVVDRGLVYTLAQLEDAYPKTGDGDFIISLPDDKLPQDLPDHTTLLGALAGRADLISLYTDEPTGIGNAQGWDERLYAFENELFRLNFTPQEVYALASNAACNKFKRGVRDGRGGFTPRPHWELDLWRDVLKASLAHGSRDVGWSASEYDMSSTFDLSTGELEERVYASAKKRFELRLLNDEELERVKARRTFIDVYVDWATSKTDAAVVYHIASAFTILSVIFGEFAHAMPKFGKLRLNLWFLVLGRTTRARKSTSRGLMMKIFDGVQGEHYEYDEGSDFTGEGLLERLYEKPRRSSIIHRDEVQGLFREVKSKHYMMGLSETLTELYDGIVRGSLRKGGGKKERVETNFVLFLMGIVSKVTEVLTLDDFQSGFLARFIHVIGEAPPRTRESEWLDQADPMEIAKGDPAYINIVSNLMKERAFWHKLVPDRQTVALRFTEEAWRRWNDMNWDLQESIRNHERVDVLEAGVDRMGKSCIKAAALLAMTQCRTEVNLDDVLTAIYYVNGWAEDMIASAEMISESFWKKDMTTLHDIVLSKGTISWGDAYSKMDKQPGEFKNLVEGLVLSEKVRIRIDDSTKARYLEAL